MISNKRIYAIAFVLLPILATAQTMVDGIFMLKKSICGGFMLNQDKFDTYWEGTKLRTNANMGTMTMTAVGAMVNYGITDKFNIIASQPYLKTQASAGVMAGKAGFQDLTLGLKYKAFTVKHFDFIAIAGGTLPISNYVAAYPLAIGNQCKAVFGRAMLHYLHPKGWTFVAQTGYMLRSNIKIDQSNYFTNKNVYSTDVRMDDVFQWGLRGGFYSYRWATEMTLDQSKVLGGFDIRRNDGMFPANRQEATRLGLLATYRLKPLHDLQVVGNVAYTVSGRNVGQALSLGGGLMMAFDFKKKKEEAK